MGMLERMEAPKSNVRADRKGRKSLFTGLNRNNWVFLRSMVPTWNGGSEKFLNSKIQFRFPLTL